MSLDLQDDFKSSYQSSGYTKTGACLLICGWRRSHPDRRRKKVTLFSGPPSGPTQALSDCTPQLALSSCFAVSQLVYSVLLAFWEIFLCTSWPEICILFQDAGDLILRGQLLSASFVLHAFLWHGAKLFLILLQVVGRAGMWCEAEG